MRWSWLVPIGLPAIAVHHLTGRWDLAVATALAVALLVLGHGTRHRARARLLHRRGTGVAPRTVHTASRAERTALDHHEQRRFRAIEEQLASEDPRFAERIRALDRPDHPAAVGRLTAVIGLGLAVAVIGFVSDPALVVIGVLIAAPASALRVLVTAPRQAQPAAGPDDDEPSGPDRGAPV
ncbi:DUF3040 domain-containing protein [Saccharothrix longispora]|uniref:DUF3040 family protein n=1 Tax=Saccharothrix longispora TaxID=33920 RepID=A0ABU1PUI7_9PSEU|nr:DUF3040 domain-containing protein [Saccharothrix longispora]MDR6594307.1 hypothetical protein [Saccharothrix longispora]